MAQGTGAHTLEERVASGDADTEGMIMAMYTAPSVTVPLPRGYLAALLASPEHGKCVPGIMLSDEARRSHLRALGISASSALGSAVRHIDIRRGDAKRLAELYSPALLARALQHGAMVCPVLADAGITHADVQARLASGTTCLAARNDATLHSGTITCPACIGVLLSHDEAQGATADSTTMMMSRAPRKAREGDTEA